MKQYEPDDRSGDEGESASAHLPGVLFLTESPEITERIRRLFLSAGELRVYTAASPEEALEWLRFEEIHLLITECGRKMDTGGEPVRTAKSLAPHTGIGELCPVPAPPPSVEEVAGGRVEYRFPLSLNDGELAALVGAAAWEIRQRIERRYQEGGAQGMTTDVVLSAINMERMVYNYEELVEGIIKATVQTIEARDPMAGNHSVRLAHYARITALSINGRSSGPFAAVSLDPDELRQLHYAALLHAFGKVWVEPRTFLKDKKLHPEQLNEIRWKFDYLLLYQERLFDQQNLQIMSSGEGREREGLLEQIKGEKRERLERIRELRREIEELNEISVFTEPSADRVERIVRELSEFELRDSYGRVVDVLTADEARALSATPEILSEDERRSYEHKEWYSHVFTRQIPWPSHLCGIPQILRAFYEKKRGLRRELEPKSDITALSAQILAVADIYEDLTAVGRPWKRLLPPEQARLRMQFELAEKGLDQDVADLFLELIGAGR